MIASIAMTAKTAVMLRLLKLPWTLEPTQIANRGAPVQRLIEQTGEAVTSPTFFSAIAPSYISYGAVALRWFEPLPFRSSCSQVMSASQRS